MIGGPGARRAERPRGTKQLLLVFAALTVVAVILVLPLAVIFHEALSEGLVAYRTALTDPDTVAALRLSLTAVAIAVPLNTLFGVAAAWLLARFKFRGRSVLLSLIDLPLATSPVVAGMMIMLIFGSTGTLEWLTDALGVKIVFATPAIVLATIFVTLPFVVRELLPLMQAAGREEEEAALTLGASGRQLFVWVTLPHVFWALLYGIILCNARAIGEFGAVSVVSGHIRGETNTLPLHIEILYNEYSFAASFAVVSLLSLVALATLALQSVLQWHQRRSG